MTAEEKSVLSLFMIGVLIVVGKVLAGGEPITPRLFIGRMLLGGFVSMVAGVVLVQFPDLSLPAVCGIGSMLGICCRHRVNVIQHSVKPGCFCLRQFPPGL